MFYQPGGVLPQLPYIEVFVFNEPQTQSNSTMAIDNIFIDVSNHENYIMLPLFNGLSDHDAQLIILNYIKVGIKNVRSKQIRKIDYSNYLIFNIN
jgi:hypothetical protein